MAKLVKVFTRDDVTENLKKYLREKEAEAKKLKAQGASPEEIQGCILCIKMLIREVPKYFGILFLALSAHAQEAVPGQFVVKLKTGRIVKVDEATANALEEKALYREPNYIYHALEIPWGVEKIRAPHVWSAFQGRGILVGVVDTGIDYTHPDLLENIESRGFNAITGKDDAMDDNSHGTHCAGTIAATMQALYTGVAPKAKLFGAKFLNKDGSGALSDAITAINWAVDHGAQVLSNSWGGGPYSRALEETIQRACDKGVVFLAAAGNSKNNNDRSPSYPASYKLPCVISVGAVDEEGNLASFSNYGKSVHVSAPGVKIPSTIPGGHATYSGTSMATPHVAGVAALMLSKKALSAPEIRQVLVSTGSSVPAEKCPWWKFWCTSKTVGPVVDAQAAVSSI